LKNRGYSCGHNRVAKLMKEITKKLAGQMKDEERLDEEIKKQLKNIGFDLEE
jgi:hypothetical protein